MPRIHFLANVPDPNDPETIYGKGHVMDVTDEAWAAQLNNEGKAEILPDPDVPAPQKT